MRICKSYKEVLGKDAYIYDLHAKKYQGVHQSLNNVRFEYHILTPTMIINILGYVQHQPSSIKTNNPVLISRGKCKQFAKLL